MLSKIKYPWYFPCAHNKLLTSQLQAYPNGEASEQTELACAWEAMHFSRPPPPQEPSSKIAVLLFPANASTFDRGTKRACIWCEIPPICLPLRHTRKVKSHKNGDKSSIKFARNVACVCYTSYILAVLLSAKMSKHSVVFIATQTVQTHTCPCTCVCFVFVIVMCL